MTINHQSRTLLAVFAHPDDESFTCGGSMARYAAEGVHVALVCATRGEVGEIADDTLATRENLGEVREGELRSAAKALGVDDVTFLGYRDSGMAGTTDNENPGAFANAPEEEVVSRLVGFIRRLRRQVVLTFDPSGGYGHPDHMSVHRHTVAAFHAASVAESYPEQGDPWQPSRLLYPVFTKGMIHRFRELLATVGEDTSRFEREGDDLGWPDDQVHVVMDVSDTIEAKWQALSAHKTQFGTFSLFRRIPEADAKAYMSAEPHCLAYPEPAEGTRLEHLFDGI